MSDEFFYSWNNNSFYDLKCLMLRQYTICMDLGNYIYILIKNKKIAKDKLQKSYNQLICINTEWS